MDAFKPYEQSVRKAYLTLHRQTQRTMEIKEIYIKNFRNIGEEGATIKLSPVTIFTGCNSAGKSTAAKALLLLEAYLSDLKSDSFNFIDTQLDFSKVIKLGSFDSVINKTAKRNGHNEITLGYSFASAILVADIKVFLTFGKKDTDALNNGWLKELSIFINTTELLSIFIKDNHYHLDIKDKDKFIEYIRYYKVRQIVSLWKEYEEERNASQIYQGMEAEVNPKMENLRSEMPELLALEKKLVKDGVIRNYIWETQVDKDLKKSINSSVIISALENIIEFNWVDTIINDAEKSKGCRLSHDDVTMICNKIRDTYIEKLGDRGIRLFNKHIEEKERYIQGYINSEFSSFPEFKKYEPVLDDFIKIFNDQENQDLAKNISASKGILEIIKFYSSYKESIALPLRYILNQTLNQSFNNKFGYVDASTVDVKRLYLLDHSDSFGNLWKRFNDMKAANKHHNNIERGTFMRTWLRKFDICDDYTIENSEGSLRIKLITEEIPEGRLLADYGYGVTQLVALLLNIEIAINNVEDEFLRIEGEPIEFDSVISTIPYMLILEEPEVHLHPCLQSRLADMFLDASRYGVKFVIETHSEYFVRRTQVLVSDMKLNEDNIDNRNEFRVYYFPKDGAPYDMKYLPSGRFECTFGEGFFDESARWHMEILKRERNRK